MASTPVRIGAVVSSAVVTTTAVITVGVGGVPSGATIYIGGFWGHASVNPVVPTDTKGNTYVQRAGPVGAGDDGWAWTADNITALVSGDTITVTSPAGNTETMVAAYYITGEATSAFDVAKPSNGTGTAATSGDLTTAGPGIVIGQIGWQSGGSTSVALSNGWTQLDSTSPASGDGAQWGYHIYGSAQTTGDALAATLGGTTPAWVAIAISLKDAAGAAAGPQTASPPRVFVPRRNPSGMRRQLPFMSGQRLAFPQLPPGATLPLTAAITASAAVASTNTESAAVTAALAPSVAVTGTSTEAKALTAALTASAAVAGTSTEAVALSAALSASAAVTGTATSGSLVAITAALTASASVSGTNTEATALTGPLSGAAVVAGATNQEAVALSAPLTGSAAIAGTNKEAVALSAAITSSAVVAGTITSAGSGALSATITASAVVAGVNVETAPLTAAAAATSVVAGSQTFTKSLSAALAGTVSIASTNRQAVALAAAFTSSAAIAAIATLSGGGSPVGEPVLASVQAGRALASAAGRSGVTAAGRSQSSVGSGGAQSSGNSGDADAT